MEWWLWTIIVYSTGFVLALYLNAGSPATPGLMLLRSFLWPLWIFGLIPGRPLPMD